MSSFTNSSNNLSIESNSNLKIVALGGGHGLAATLTALRNISQQITAIVTVADNGGSSGRLREEFHMLPPGDLRMALAALCSDDDWGRRWAEIMQYRFTSNGPLAGHAVGNLLLTALWDRDGDAVLGLDRVAELLKVVGRVLPMALEPLDIEGTFTTGNVQRIIRGQKEVATAEGKILELALIPSDPTPTAAGLAAIATADWITIGPGSWFSSVLPHFLVKRQLAAILKSPAKKLLILNLDATPAINGEEFAGNTPAEHLAVLKKYAPEFTCDVALADLSIVNESDDLNSAITELGGELHVANLASPGNLRHDPEKLATAFSHIFSS